jgi:hypothetical protein
MSEFGCHTEQQNWTLSPAHQPLYLIDHRVVCMQRRHAEFSSDLRQI